MALALALALDDIQCVSRSIRIFIFFHDFIFHSVRIDAKLIAFDFHHITFNCKMRTRPRVRDCETQLCANSEQIQAIMGGVKHTTKKSAPLGSCREPIVSVGFCLNPIRTCIFPLPGLSPHTCECRLAVPIDWDSSGRKRRAKQKKKRKKETIGAFINRWRNKYPTPHRGARVFSALKI